METAEVIEGQAPEAPVVNEYEVEARRLGWVPKDDFKGDPDFARTAAAFKTIKASKCAEAFDEALELFPDAKPPQDITKRLEIYQAVPQRQREAIDAKFFSESNEVNAILAKYIRENRDHFKHLE